MDSWSTDDETSRTMLRIYGRKKIECRYHHIVATVAMHGSLRHDTVFHLAGTSYDADTNAMQPHMRGVILTPSMSIVPNFSHTPRIVYSSSFVSTLMQEETVESPPRIVVMPAVNARLVRMFCTSTDGASPWRFATNRGVRANRTTIVTKFKQAVECQTGHSFGALEQRLDRGRVWFFLLPREGSPLVYGLGSTDLIKVVPPASQPAAGSGKHSTRNHRWKIERSAAMRLSIEGLPAVPSLRTVLASSGYSSTCTGISLWQTARLEAETLKYADQFNGVMVLNLETLVAMRVVDPLVFLLGRLVEGREKNPMNTIVRVLLTHYIIGSQAFDHFRHSMQPVFAVHAALGALSCLFPAEYAQCVDRVFMDMREGNLTYGYGDNINKMVNTIVSSI